MTTPEEKATPEEKGQEFIEFVGFGQHGTEFHSSHTVRASDLKPHNVELGAKELAWTKENGFRVPVKDMSPDAAAFLEKDPMFKRVKP